ncbi:MAG: SufD family Fe-S cluster assembly protein [Erysipelotrichaceae bacterium]|nr:SufD family Fe-S cluster assembly protein [Erysipelotrichaceae bacterium]
MNKILIDTKEYDLIIDESDSYSIEILESSKINIIVKKDIHTKISILVSNKDLLINLKLEENSNLVVNQLLLDTSMNLNIKLNKFANIKYVASFLSSLDLDNIININHEETSTSKVIINGVNLKNKFYLTMNGIIPKNSSNSILEESSKIINLDNKSDSKIIPNLIIDNKDVVANHSAFIGEFSLNEVNYLRSRGISLEDAYRLLLKANLLNGMELEIDMYKFIYAIRNYKIGR